MTYPQRPVTAFTLSVIGLSLQAVAALYTIPFLIFGGGLPAAPVMMGPWMMMGGAWFYGFGWQPFTASFGLVVIAMGVLGVVWLNTSDIGKIRSGATLVLASSIMAFPTMFGFMIGSLLMFVGGLLGLMWQPARRM